MITASPIVRFVKQTPDQSDCCVSAMAMALDITYEQSLVYLARVQPGILQTGANWAEVRRAAKLHGATLVERRKFSLDDDSDDAGILCVTLGDGTPHAVYARMGMIFDGRTNTVWESDVYLSVHNGTATSMLVRVK